MAEPMTASEVKKRQELLRTEARKSFSGFTPYFDALAKKAIKLMEDRNK